MSVRFYDKIYVIECDKNRFSNFILLKDKEDGRTLLQKRADKDRFRRNNIEKYGESLSRIIRDKIKKYKEREDPLDEIKDQLWQLFRISNLPENEKDLKRIKVFLDLYYLMDNIDLYQNKETNKEIFLQALDVLKSLEM
jgi:arginyl-tRNA synthetase